ncbi:MbtH family protein [Streptomyces sp. NPDC051677]|uniref:MbtH family protein n=1 Tax=Streptomyces sp. NPDC051677 TaxID=3365669 RepID=UPI0037CF0EE2
MSNPFDDDNSRYLVVANDEEQHALWPAHLEVPAGWQVVHAEADRASCSVYIERAWQDMRPRSIR